MNIAILGAGRIGSAFAFHLGRAGHQITLVARGKRLERLRIDQGTIEAMNGETTTAEVAEHLDMGIPWDLVLVTVLASQVDAVLPALSACAAASIIFMFNTFDDIQPLREAVGAHRARFAFPNMIAFLEQGRLRSVVSRPGMVTATDSEEWVALFKSAGLPAELRPDMQSYFRSHVAFVVPMMAAAHMTPPEGPGVTWRQAQNLAIALNAGLKLVVQQGHRLEPGFVVALARLPRIIAAAMLWTFSRTKTNRDLAHFGPGEVRFLIDSMVEQAPGTTAALLNIKP
ncbi:2-dehydropantoate 2-reductase N-terminal domain-containing protein [Mitsuaria sp. CC2]|uniref:ketopantoate reductase family protein n=1 Tax=Mitsuaria sp. CC2 TaxID=3029186 RepID=UPI003B8D13FD